MTAYPVEHYREMILAKRILFMYRGNRIIHKYSAGNARMSALMVAYPTKEEYYTHLAKYNHYWRLR